MKTAHNAIDMTGKVYNKWKVIKKVEGSGKRTGGAAWIAECLGCNNTYVVKGANIRSGMSKQCLKCGCKHGHDLQKGQTRTKRTPQESAYHYLFLQLRKEAKKRGFEWALTESDTHELVSQNCTYCNTEPSLICNPLRHMNLSQSRVDGSTIKRGGIDRVDSRLGYVPGNVVPCCVKCNSAKMDRSVDDFIAWARKLVDFQDKKERA